MFLALCAITVCEGRAYAAKPGQAIIPCRVLETMVSRQLHVRMAIFHYRDAADRERLGKILREDNGDQVRFQSTDGKWHSATLFRIRTCFGRGLLVFRVSEAQLAAKQDFLLRVAESVGK
ncbi:MAG: hypothetical protein ACRD3T_04635 [Terriglobia bacterium]